MIKWFQNQTLKIVDAYGKFFTEFPVMHIEHYSYFDDMFENENFGNEKLLKNFTTNDEILQGNL